MDEIIKVDTVDQYNELYGLETLHPLVGIVDLTKATRRVNHVRVSMGLYALFLKHTVCGDLKYGKKQYDYQEGTIVGLAPGQVIGIELKADVKPSSTGIVFHPDLIRGTSLGQAIKKYSFFSYEANEALHLSEEERQIITDCFHKISIELGHEIDRHSKTLIAKTSNCCLITACVFMKGSSTPAAMPTKISWNSLRTCWTITSWNRIPKRTDSRPSNILRTKSAFRPIISAI